MPAIQQLVVKRTFPHAYSVVETWSVKVTDDVAKFLKDTAASKIQQTPVEIADADGAANCGVSNKVMLVSFDGLKKERRMGETAGVLIRMSTLYCSELPNQAW